MLTLESETLVVWASYIALCRKGIVTALSSVSPTCHQLGAGHTVGSGMGPLVTGLTEQTFKNAISVMGERQKTLCGGKKNGCNST